MKLQKPKIPDKLIQSENINEIVMSLTSSGYDIENYHFKSCSLNDISSISVEFSKCIIEKCSIKKCDVQNFVFDNVIFRDCDISNMDFSDAVFRSTEFINCNLTGIILSHTRLSDISVSSCNM